MDNRTDLQELEKEVTSAFNLGVEEFRIDSFAQSGLGRAKAIATHFKIKGYRSQIVGRKDVDRESEYFSRYSVIVKP